MFKVLWKTTTVYRQSTKREPEIQDRLELDQYWPSPIKQPLLRNGLLDYGPIAGIGVNNVLQMALTAKISKSVKPYQVLFYCQSYSITHREIRFLERDMLQHLCLGWQWVSPSEQLQKTNVCHWSPNPVFRKGQILLCVAELPIQSTEQT
jgi:hypothetical protein